MSTNKNIWVSNSCGQLFIFKDVPIEDGDIDGWWDANEIDDVVGNNLNSCEWGEYESTKTIRTPRGGWAVEETDDDEEDKYEITWGYMEDGEVAGNWDEPYSNLDEATEAYEQLVANAPANKFVELFEHTLDENGDAVDSKCLKYHRAEEDSDDEDSDDMDEPHPVNNHASADKKLEAG